MIHLFVSKGIFPSCQILKAELDLRINPTLMPEIFINVIAELKKEKKKKRIWKVQVNLIKLKKKNPN